MIHDKEPPLLEMTPDGRFYEPSRTPLIGRIGRVAFVVAVLCGILASIALTIYIALLLIPIALGAGLIAYAAFRYQMWRARQRQG